MKGVVAGGAAIVDDDVVTVAGIREPGLEDKSETSGVYLFSLRGEPVSTTTTTSTTQPDVEPSGTTQPAGPQEFSTLPARCRFPDPAARRPEPLDDAARHP